ncbi:receptor-like protein kinase FERONIA isoform X2 [Helianthus annuus]|uniref:receptor-like protein kinase FERONIA isoform X2 n=1 Tax=Helianthus annuus TaxID=4232 RepID=UPI000B903FA2|nr:receptor-like protein kinase FERONIA isoform X2 [Helianthus annuus]
MDTTNEEGGNSSSPTSAHPFRLFSLAEIQYATKNFDDELVIGQGGFGKVFKGYISSEEVGHVVAIKRLDSMSDQGEPEFRAEIDMLSKLRHSHLVSLIGYCHENKEKILVYEYMSNGTLYHHLHKADTPLTWLTRLNIAIGAARGLAYLHTSRVIHRDVKSSNILLDENWAAMISDFGLSKIGPDNQPISCVNASVKGTFGYLDPEYFYTRKLTRKSDVYSYGIVLFELLSGRLAVDERNEEDECSLVRWAQRCVKERKLDQIVDSNIKGTISAKCLKRFAQIADRCVHNDPKERPSMTQVVASLQALSVLQEKSNHSGESSNIMGFNWKVHKYLVSRSKPNSDQSGTSSPNRLDNNLNQHEESVTRGLKSFSYDELTLATRDFGFQICLDERSHYGMVYKGWVDKTTYTPFKDNTELPIVVKKLPYSHNKLEMLKEFCHPNIVKPLGEYYHFLVYEFKSNGNFEDLLLSGVVARLSLDIKVKILVGIARGTVFLKKPQLKKTWLKVGDSMLDRHKIWLDEDFTAKIADYDSNHYVLSNPDIERVDLALECNLSGYKVIFMEVLIGERIFSSNRVAKIETG